MHLMHPKMEPNSRKMEAPFEKIVPPFEKTAPLNFPKVPPFI
jgi:hypothetical protein